MNMHRMMAFTDGDRGGNAAGVVLDADDLDRARRQAVARQVGASETAFVSQAAGYTARVEFFTPVRQIVHCGHATVATFALLRQLERIGDGIHSKLSVDGPRAVRVEDGRVWLSQTPPVIANADLDASLLARAMQLSSAHDVAEQPVIVDVGNRFLHITVRDAATLRDVVPDQDCIAALSERLDLIGWYVAAPDASSSDRAATTRMFAPRYGIPEEPATGMAAGGLGALLAWRAGVSEAEFLIEQGRMSAEPSPSLLRVRIEGRGAIERVWTGGSATRVEPVASR